MNRLLMVTACWLFIFIISIPLQAGEILLTIPQPPPGYYSQYFGRSVANVGDHNGDGFDDFIVGQPGFLQNGGTTYGYAHFFHGGPYVTPLPEISMQGPNWDARLGWSVTELGDFNADGQPDFAASRPGGDVSGVNVYWGGDVLDNEVDLSLTNNQSYSWFGGKISGGHDLNGDGHPDLVVAANQDDSGPGEDGRIYIYHGGPLADQQVDMILDAQFPTAGFGYNLQLTGDVTGDGWADLLVLNWDPHLLLIYAGGPDFDADPDIQIDLPDQGYFPEYWSPDQLLPQVEAGDLDGDGQPEIVIGLPLESSGGQAWVLQAGPDQGFAMGRVLHARSSGECFGRMIDISGDYNGDGIADLLVGSRGPYPSGLNGYLFVYPGGDLDDLNLSLVMTDQERYRRFGASAVSLGDLDGDGDDELLVGSVSPYGYVWIVDELFFDCDDDDVPDWQQGAEDCDGDLIPDICQVALWPQDDCNTNGVVDSCEITQDPGIDCDGNGLIDSCEIEAYPDLDCDENGILDSCQLPADPGLDCDGNGQIDSCEIEDDPSLDCDQNAILDVCQLAADPGLDCDSNGQIDSCEIAAQANLDCDQNGVLDSCQLAEDPGWDCDNNGLFDICEWTANPGLDCNLNSILDVCELAADPDLDCDGNGVIDACQIASDYMADSDGDGVLDICQFPGILSLYSNSEYTSSNLSVSEPGPVGPFYLVLNIPLEAGLVSHVEMSMTWPESLAGLDVQVEPGLAYDADPATEGLVLYYGEPMVPDADGNLMVAQVWGILPDADVMDIQISIMGNSSAAANPDLTVPSWTDDTGETHLITETNPGNINGDLSDSPPVESPFRLTLNNHPNPFNPRTTIRMELPVAGAATLEILDLSGRVIREFEIVADSAGSRDLVWHGTDRQGRQVASGIYLARLTQGSHSAQKKLVLLR